MRYTALPCLSVTCIILDTLVCKFDTFFGTPLKAVRIFQRCLKKPKNKPKYTIKGKG